jgi:hypothetical protein
VKESGTAEFFYFHGRGFPETSHKTADLLACETPIGFVFAVSTGRMFG